LNDGEAQASLCDAFDPNRPIPWAEAHGYFQWAAMRPVYSLALPPLSQMNLEMVIQFTAHRFKNGEP
jgi:hypothetical protein